MLRRTPDTQEAAAQSTRRSLALHRHPPPRGRSAQAIDGCGRGKTKIVCLEDQIHIGAKLNAFSIGHREQAVVVQHVVECFNRFGINVTIAHDPIVRVGRLFDHPASTGGQHTIEPLPVSWSMCPIRRTLVMDLGFMMCTTYFLCCLL